MIARTLDAGLSCAWVLADALYGADSKARRRLEDRRQAFGRRIDAILEAKAA